MEVGVDEGGGRDQELPLQRGERHRPAV
jgi:hypothetical protein